MESEPIRLALTVNYVDGISLTYGSSDSRSDIYTFVGFHTSCPTRSRVVGSQFVCLPQMTLNTQFCRLMGNACGELSSVRSSRLRMI